jgi:hypothetical protein
VTESGRDPQVERLTALVTRQRQELDRLWTEAAARSVLDLARGMLMERLGCSAADARSQLARTAETSGTSQHELAGQIAGLPPDVAEAAAGPARASVPAQVVLADAAMELAADGSGMAAAMLDEALAATGAAAVAIWLIAPDGAIELAGEAGFGAGEASRWRRIPPGVTALAQQAARGLSEFWWPNGRPSADHTPLMGRWDDGARAVVPLRSEARSAHALGSLEICWPEAIGEFQPQLRHQVNALAHICAQALGTRLGTGEVTADHRASWVFGLLDGLHESVLFGHAIRAEDGTPVDFRIVHISPGFTDPDGRSGRELVGQSLLEAYPATAVPGGLCDRALEVLATGQPQQLRGELIGAPLGNGAIVMTNLRIARLFDGVAITWRHAAEAERLGALLEHAQRLGRIGGWEENLAAGTVHWTEPTFALFGSPEQPVALSELHQQVPSEDIPAVEAFLAALIDDRVPTAAFFRIIRQDDASVRQIRAFAEPVTDHYGALLAVRGAYQDVSSHYHTEVALAATRDQLTDTQERAEEEHRLAIRLQEAITPQSSHLVEGAGLEVAARYRPAGQGHLVSGDWYDAVLLPTKQVMLVVGDVAGHGIDAVTGMVALRNCLRGLAITGAGPAMLLTWLNSVACHLTDDILGTAICGLYDPASGILRWARAGHLPPALVRDGKASQLPQPEGVLLGADTEGSYAEASVQLLPGDTLLLFTDGLIERRDQPIDESIAAMLTIASLSVSDTGGFADFLMAQATSDTEDDACLLAVTLR